MFQCAGAYMRVKGCSQPYLIKFPSFHFNPTTYLLISHYPIIPYKNTLFPSFSPLPHGFTYFPVWNPFKMSSVFLKTPFPILKPIPHGKITFPFINFSIVPQKPIKTPYPKVLSQRHGHFRYPYTMHKKVGKRENPVGRKPPLKI